MQAWTLTAAAVVLMMAMAAHAQAQQVGGRHARR